MKKRSIIVMQFLIISLAIPNIALSQAVDFVIQKENVISIGYVAPYSKVVGVLTAKIQQRALGFYYIQFGATIKNEITAAIRVYNNSSNGHLIFAGTFLINDEPVKLIDWGPGKTIPPGSSLGMDGKIYLKKNIKKFSFVPEGTWIYPPY